jgi:hypothetical protein
MHSNGRSTVRTQLPSHAAAFKSTERAHQHSVSAW